MYSQNFESLIGPLCVSADDSAVLSIEFNYSKINRPNGVTKQCITELEEYFEGSRKHFEVNLKPAGTDFQISVWSKLKEIPYGKSISYSDLAISLGDLKKIRAAGTANGKNKIPIIIPCHRVIGKDGSLVGFAGGLDKKEWLLKHEGIIKGEQMNIFS